MEGQLTIVGNIVKVGDSHTPIPVADIKRLKQKFDGLDTKQCGEISWDRLDALKGGAGFPGAWSQKLLESKRLQKFKRRGSVFSRIDQRLFNFKDVLRLVYADVAEADILLLDDLAKNLIGIKTKVTNYPKARREAAYKVYLRTCLDGRAAYLGDLEDLLFTRFPDFPQYQALKMLNDATLNRLYEDEPIGMEEFCVWYMTLEDQESGKAAPGGKVKQHKNPNAVFGSYLHGR
eukprot:jgi/Tetstr1/444563/TSEL_000291.t1